MDVTTQSGESEHFPNFKMSDTVKLFDLKGNPIELNSQGGGETPSEEDPKPDEDPTPAEDDPTPAEDDPTPAEDDSCPSCIDAPQFSTVATTDFSDKF